MAEGIYYKYGFDTINEIVHDFYGRVLKSEIANPFFEGIDMERLIHHQTQFLCFLLGGPVQYSGGELEKMHSKYKITDEAFVEVAELLEETLEDHGMEDDEIEVINHAIHERKMKIVYEA